MIDADNWGPWRGAQGDELSVSAQLADLSTHYSGLRYPRTSSTF